MAQECGSKNTAYKHGFAMKGKTFSIYSRWRNMINRCHVPTHKDYPRYGADGVTVCDEWRFGVGGESGFTVWLRDMGPPPFPGASLDRKDGSKGYSKENCRWASARDQANNRKNNVWLTINGQTLTVAQWARIVGVGPKTIGYRLRAGASPEEAVFKTPNHGKKLSTRSNDNAKRTKQPPNQTANQGRRS